MTLQQGQASSADAVVGEMAGDTYRTPYYYVFSTLTAIVMALVVFRLFQKVLPNWILSWSRAARSDPRGAFTQMMIERTRREEEERRKRAEPERRAQIMETLRRGGCVTVLTASDLKTAPVPADIETPSPCDTDATTPAQLCIRGDHNVANCCAICLCPYKIGDTVMWSNNPECQHLFHEDCILPWLVKMQPEDGTACPCCRRQFVCDSGGDVEKGEISEQPEEEDILTRPETSSSAGSAVSTEVQPGASSLVLMEHGTGLECDRVISSDEVNSPASLMDRTDSSVPDDM